MVNIEKIELGLKFVEGFSVERFDDDVSYLMLIWNILNSDSLRLYLFVYKVAVDLDTFGSIVLVWILGNT